jgi:hypothetical protein
MTWEQKLAALKALADASLRMRAPGDWYVSHSVNVTDHPCMSRGFYGNGTTPEEAVNDHWRQLVDELGGGHYLKVLGTPDKFYRWNGFMWAEFQDPFNQGEAK